KNSQNYRPHTLRRPACSERPGKDPRGGGPEESGQLAAFVTRETALQKQTRRPVRAARSIPYWDASHMLQIAAFCQARRRLRVLGADSSCAFSTIGTLQSLARARTGACASRRSRDATSYRCGGRGRIAF